MLKSLMILIVGWFYLNNAYCDIQNMFDRGSSALAICLEVVYLGGVLICAISLATEEV